MKNKKYSLFIGRFQPLHEGHIACIDKLLKEKRNVLIAVRDMKVNKKNPSRHMYVLARISRHYKDKIIKGRIKLISLQDINEVVYGRNVGYKIRKLKLSKKIEKISATKIRNKK